jgi:hypothetical protein
VTVATDRLAELAAWIALNSKSRRTRLGTISFGPWAVIEPSDVAEPPMPSFDPAALPIFVPIEQTEGVAVAAIDKGAPDSQIRMADRLAHLIWRVQDRTLPPVAIVGLESPAEPLQDAIAAAGAMPWTRRPSQSCACPCGPSRPRNWRRSGGSCHCCPNDVSPLHPSLVAAFPVRAPTDRMRCPGSLSCPQGSRGILHVGRYVGYDGAFSENERIFNA